MKIPALHELEATYAKFAFKKANSGRRRLWLKLAKMTANGVQIVNAIESIRNRRIAAGGKNDPETIALTTWLLKIKNGARLSDAIRGWVGSEEAMLISAGEQSGTFQQALLSTARVMEAKKHITAAIVSGLSYPFFLMLMAFGVLYLFGFKIVPAFTSVVRNEAAWHGMAKAMIAVSHFAQQWLWLLGLVLVGLIVVFFVSLPRFDGPLRIKLDRYAPYSVYRITQGSTWLIAIAALVEAGVRIENALEQLAATGSPWLRRRLQACLFGMRAGHNMGDALARSGYDFPDREIVDDLGVYAALSGFDEGLAMLGREWLTESVEQITGRMHVVFGVSILIVGGLIAFMAGGMMEMQLQLSQALQGNIR